MAVVQEPDRRLIRLVRLPDRPHRPPAGERARGSGWLRELEGEQKKTSEMHATTWRALGRGAGPASNYIIRRTSSG